MGLDSLQSSAPLSTQTAEEHQAYQSSTSFQHAVVKYIGEERLVEGG